MNILFIASDFNPSTGGVPRVTDILAHEFEKRGHSVTYLSYKTKGEDPGNNYSFPTYYMNRTIRESFNHDSIILYQNILRERKIDIIINQYPILGKNDLFLCHRLPGVKALSVFHGKPFFYSDLEWIHFKQTKIGISKLRSFLRYWKLVLQQKRRFQSIIKNSDRLCLLSNNFFPDLLSKCHKINTTKLCSIGNPNTFLGNSSINTSTKQNIILFVGRLQDKVKNLGDFIKVWELLYASNPDWKAVVVGNDTNIEHHKKYIKDNKIKNIEFAGFSRNVRQFYEKSKIFAMTSHYEGWPMTITEAMACGCVPCAFYTYKSLTELISDGDDGFIIEPYNVKDMAQKMQFLIDNTSVLSAMSVKAQDHIKKHDVSIVANEWELLFDKLN